MDAGAEAEADAADAVSEAPSCRKSDTPCSSMADCCAGSICVAADAAFGAGVCSEVCHLPRDCASGCCIGVQGPDALGYCFDGCTH
jgi:hypothetical protein